MIFYTKGRNMNWKNIEQVIEQASLEVTLEICIPEVLGSNVGTDSGYPDRHYGSFSQ
jgi:hypothetical protein